MKIVCFHLNQVGDLAFSLPALKAIRDSYPDAHIVSVTRPSAREVLESTGLVDAVMSRNSGINPNKYRLIGRLAKAGFDLAVVFSQSAECALLARVTRAPTRIGFVNTSLGWLLTRRVDFHHPPSTENNLRLVEAAGCAVTRRDYTGLLRPSAAHLERAERMLADCGVTRGDTLVALAPGTSGRRSVKEWTDTGFARVAAHLLEEGAKVVALGARPAYSIAEQSDGIVDLGGKTDLGEAVAVLARCRALVAVDSGILHLAAAVGRPVVGLYGPSDPAVTGPQGEGHVVLASGAQCSPCVSTTCNRARKCMLEIRAEDVITAIDSVLQREETKL